MFFFFFFQAEDGIRDADVTGVQTCTLPICWDRGVRGVARRRRPTSRPCGCPASSGSEERRVGKECRSRWSPDHYNKKRRNSTQTTNLASKQSKRDKPIINTLVA